MSYSYHGELDNPLEHNSDRVLFRKKIQSRYYVHNLPGLRKYICTTFNAAGLSIISSFLAASSNKVLRKLCSRWSTIPVCISLRTEAINTGLLLYQGCLRLGRTHLIYWVVDHQGTHVAQNVAYKRDAL